MSGMRACIAMYSEYKESWSGRATAMGGGGAVTNFSICNDATISQFFCDNGTIFLLQGLRQGHRPCLRRDHYDVFR
jgi:hypothetical protein